MELARDDGAQGHVRDACHVHATTLRPAAPAIARVTTERFMARDAVHDPLRLASLLRSGLLDSPPEETFDRLTRLASRLLGARVALMSLVDEDRQFFKSSVGLSGDLAARRETPLSHSYCQHVVNSGEALVVADAREHPLLRDNPAIEDHSSISYCGVPLVDPAGRVLGTLCVVDEEVQHWSDDQVETLQEIATAIVAEVQLRLAAADLEDRNRSLREFIAMASHDIRSPLSAILMYSHLLNEDDLSQEDRQEFADGVTSAARQASALVGELLEISKIDAGALEPKAAVINLRTAVDKSLRALGTDLLVSVRVPADVWTCFDPAHLDRILTNLVENALRYGAAPVSVDAWTSGGDVSIGVTDRGAGVPLDFVPRLFERFARSDEARAVRPEGTGLGLAIVAGLAEANGASVRYEVNQPHGSRFILKMQSPRDPA